MVTVYSKYELEELDWIFIPVDQGDGTWMVSIEKVVTEDDGSETLYAYAKIEDSEFEADNVVIIYGSMVEYGLIAEKWEPQEMAFPKDQLYQFIQPSTLEQLEAMYPDTVVTAYNNAMAYVQSYIGAMFDVDAMIEEGGTTSTALTLRLALCISTVTYILASSPQYSEVIDMQMKQLHHLLRGLKSGNRNFGKDGIVADPNVRVTVVSLTKTGQNP